MVRHVSPNKVILPCKRAVITVTVKGSMTLAQVFVSVTVKKIFLKLS